MRIKIKSIDHTMIPFDYTELNLEQWKAYVCDCVRENEVLNQANAIINPEQPESRKYPVLTPKQKANGDIVIYAMMFIAAIGLAIFYTLKN